MLKSIIKNIIKAIVLLAWPRRGVFLQDKRRGYPLASDVIFHELSHRMARQLGRPPAGHRYVRVAQDILLIAVGTSMVVDAVYDLNHM